MRLLPLVAPVCAALTLSNPTLVRAGDPMDGTWDTEKGVAYDNTLVFRRRATP